MSRDGITALLPMKGHSERVPNKNLRVFAGRPLYHHVLEALLACPAIGGVYINTDSEAIAADARETFGDRVGIIPRPPEICGDLVSMNRIIAHDLSQLEGERFLQTHSTNPLLKSSTILAAIDGFLGPGVHDSLFSATRLQLRLYDQEARPLNHDPDRMLRTQDLPPVYAENSCLYVFSRTSFARSQRRIGERPMVFQVPKHEAIDIDDWEDWHVAEALCLHRQRVPA